MVGDMQMLKLYLLKVLFVISAIPFLIAERIPQAAMLPAIPVFQNSIFSGPITVAPLENKKIEEASGMAFSQTMTGLVYVHNDSGDSPILYMMDTLGKDMGSIALSGAINRDWEDMAIGPGSKEGVSYVYIGDIGDNSGVYEEISIYRFPEPISWQYSLTVEAESINLRYPDGSRDAESLLVDPISKDMFIVSKRDSSNVLYRFPLDAFDHEEVVLERVMDLPFTMSVAGDISSDGTEILIKNYFAVFYWKRKPGESIPETLQRDPLILPYKPEPQGEAIAFDPKGKSYYTTSEKRFGIDPILYRYDRK